LTDPSAPHGRGRSAPGGQGRPVDDGWGPSTAVHSGSARRVGRAFAEPATKRPEQAPPPARHADPWATAGPASRDQQRANRRAERSLDELQQGQRAPERGLPWWAALIVLVLIAGLGGLIDTVGSIQVRGGFNIGIVVASIVAILMVKRSHMFPVVIAPPIVYSFAAVFQLYLRSSGLHDKRVVLDAAANYLVYGFPAIAAASAAVLIIAGIRLITRK
jgi:hypothetical protein